VCSRVCTLSQYRTKLLLLSHNFSNVMINNTSTDEAHYLSLFWNVCKFNKETCVGSWDVTNALKEASYFVAKTSFPKWLQARVFHKGRVFHLFSCDWLNDCIGVMLLGPIVRPQGNCHVDSFHVPKVVLRKISRRKIL
jgi:hypothetical protein